MDKLDKAIAEFEDEISTLTFAERFSNLRQAFMWNAFSAIKKIKKYGIESPISADEEYVQVEGLKQFKILEQMYMSEVKANKQAGKKLEDLDREWLQKIHAMDSTLGSIVRNMAEKTGTDNE